MWTLTVDGEKLDGVEAYLNACAAQLLARGLTVTVTQPPTPEAPELAPVHDNEQAFKCPACGKTYDEQVECTNQHPAELTQPTSEVLSDGTEAAAKTDAGASEPLSTVKPEAEPAVADAPQPPAPASDPQPPAWPA